MIGCVKIFSKVGELKGTYVSSIIKFGCVDEGGGRTLKEFVVEVCHTLPNRWRTHRVIRFRDNWILATAKHRGIF